MPLPIKARTDMLATGIRTPVGIKVLGTDLVEMDKLARQIEAVVKAVPGTSSAYAERVIGGYYLDVVPYREALARYGLMVSDVQDTVSSALGGETVTTTVEGRELGAIADPPHPDHAVLAARRDDPISADDWVRGLIGGVGSAVFGLVVPNMLMRDRNTPYAFTGKQMGRYDITG